MSTLFRSGPATGSFSKVICGMRPTGYTPVMVEKSPTKVKPPQQICREPVTTNTLQERAAFKTGGAMTPGLRVTKGINVSSQLRFAHTDVVFPSLEDYRRDSTKDTTKPARNSEDERRAFTHALTYGVGGVMGLFIAKEAVHDIVAYKSMAADMRALASIEVEIGDIPEGTSKTFEWRGKPVFVRHRTAEEIAREKAVVVSELRDPQQDSERVKKEEWSVLIGVCTHLGCVPIAGAGDFGGYYCPCHGSHYDASGRIRKGPAPLNLEVPAYKFKDENTLVVGASD
uniref:Rieske domain-containing protein n=1 Tax=Plectus sambesii TaxID=2011161 RepID=A0A914WHI6_9BILA